MPKDITEVSSLAELEELLHASPEETQDDSADTPDDSSNDDDAATTETAQAQESVQPSDDQIREYLLKLPPQDVIRMHPGVQGTVGALSQRQARELAAKQLEEDRRRERELADQAEEDELLNLSQTNPEAAAQGFAERIATKRNQKKSGDIEESSRTKYGQMLHEEMEGIYRTPVINELASKMTDEQLAKLYWKNGQYGNFADWAEGMLTTVIEFAKEEVRKEAASAPPVKTSRPSARSEQAIRNRRDSTDDLPVNLGDSNDDSSGSYRPGDVRKMPFSEYAKNRNSIRESIFGDE